MRRKVQKSLSAGKIKALDYQIRSRVFEDSKLESSALYKFFGVVVSSDSSCFSVVFYAGFIIPCWNRAGTAPRA